MTPVMTSLTTPSVFAEAIEKVLSAPDAPSTTHEIAEAVQEQMERDGTLDSYLREALSRLLSRDTQVWMQAGRKSAKQASRRSVFATVATGDPEHPLAPNGLWLPTRYQLEGEWRTFGSLNRMELGTVADSYRKRADENALEERWLRAVARAVPEGKTVAEVFSEVQLRSLRNATVDS